MGENPMGHKIFMLLGHETFSPGNILKYLEISFFLLFFTGVKLGH